MIEGRGWGRYRRNLSPFSLEWSAPPGCPDVVWVRHQTEVMLGAPADSLAQRPLEVHGTVTKTGDRVELSLSTVDGGIRGERKIAGDTCEEVSVAGALAIALTIDPKAVTDNVPASIAAFEPLAAPPATASAAPPPSPAPADAPPVVVAAPPPQNGIAPETEGRPQTFGLIGAHATADLGTLPRLAPGLGVDAGFHRESVVVRLGATYFLPTRAESGTSEPSPGADVSLAVVDVTGCYTTSSGPSAIAPCAGLEAGFLFARGVGLDNAAEEVREWMAATIGADALLHPAEPLTLSVGLDAVVPFTRPSIGYTPRPGADGSSGDFRILYRASPVAVRAGVGVGFRFR